MKKMRYKSIFATNPQYTSLRFVVAAEVSYAAMSLFSRLESAYVQALSNAKCCI